MMPKATKVGADGVVGPRDDGPHLLLDTGALKTAEGKAEVPSLDKEGWLRPLRKCREASLAGADGVVGSSHRLSEVERTTPAAPPKERDRLLDGAATPPLPRSIQSCPAGQRQNTRETVPSKTKDLSAQFLERGLRLSRRLSQTCSCSTFVLHPRGLHGFENPGVAGATALVAGKRLTYVFGFIRVFQIVRGRDDHAGRADAALRATFFEESLLKRVELAIGSEALDRRHVLSGSLTNRNHACQNQHSIHECLAGSALSLAASLRRLSQVELFAKHIEQPLHGRRGHLIVLSIDRERNLHHDDSTSLRIRSGSTGISLMNRPPSV